MMPEILCTLGPASLDRRTIQRLELSGATLFRINLSHTKVVDLPHIIETIRDATQVPICWTARAQIRTGEFVDGSINCVTTQWCEPISGVFPPTTRILTFIHSISPGC
jgi:pyruvate kinase